MSTLELENIKHPDNSGDNIALASNGSITIDRQSTDGTIAEFRKDGTTVGSIGIEGGDVTIGKAASGLQFRAIDPCIRPHNMSTNSPSDNAVDLGRHNSRFKDLYMSGGVYLGGTGSANKLDDYEEGSWTPVVAGSTSGGWTSRAGYTQGYYTKISGYVHVDVRFETTARNSPVGNLEILGLPFPAAADTGTIRNQYMTACIVRGMNPTSDSMGHVALLSGGNSHFNIYQRRNNSAYSFDIQNVTEVPANCEGYFHFSYRTSS
jgi:hypothetical protein